MDELTSNNNIGISLEEALQEARNHTILLTDIRANSEAHRKADDKTLEQLKKLQDASNQTLEVAKAQKQQTKDSSNTLKTMQEATNATNAIVAKRQISTLTTLNTTINSGLNVVNQKLFTVMETLGSTLADAFTSVGRSLENKLYNLTGSLSIVLKPLVSVAKVGFTMISKLIAIPLKFLWEGFKTFNETLIGKITTGIAGIYLLYKFFTSTAFGKVLGNVINNYRAANKGGLVDRAISVGSFVANNPILTGLGLLLGPSIASTILTKGGGALIGKLASTIGKKGAASVAGSAAAGTIAATAPALNRYVWDGSKSATTTAAPAKVSKFAGIGSKILGKSTIGGLIGTLGLDYLANKTDNKTLSGGLNVGSAALGGAALGAMFGPVGALVGAGLGAGGSLLFGEGGAKLFGSSEESNEMQQLAQMQNSQQQASTAQINALENIAEAIHDSNKILTKVIEKQNLDAQPKINRHEATTNEQNRHADAQQTNDLLTSIADKMDTLAEAFKNLALSLTNANATNAQAVALGFTPNIGK